MAGLSIAGPTAAPWITDFLNAAFYAKPAGRRSLADLRLAWTILRTYWHRQDYRRLTARDVAPFHRAFGQARLEVTDDGGLGRLSSTDLLQGASSLLGPWFARSWTSHALRGYGVVFENAEERCAFRPEARLEAAPLGDLTPPSAALSKRTWHTYAPAPVRSEEQTLHLLRDASRWPDVASALGQFTPLRSGGLQGQTFEIELMVGKVPRSPLFVRSYVTVTRILDRGRELRTWAEELDRGVTASAAASSAMPRGAEPRFGLELTTHAGHVIGAATSNLLLFRSGSQAFLSDTGCWDPMPAHLAIAYKTVGARAQQSFWGPDEPENSMLLQMASVE